MLEERKNMTIFVDADACPVILREELQLIAADISHIHVYFVASYQHQLNHLRENVFHVKGDDYREATDLYIVNHVKAGDVVVTQDIGLASLLLLKKAHVLSHTGYLFRNETIEGKLFFRHLHAKQRRAGQKTKGPKKYTKFNVQRFKRTLNKILEKEGL